MVSGSLASLEWDWGMFWLLLQDFATLRSPPVSWASARTRHPFVTYQQPSLSAGDTGPPLPALLTLNLPDSVALPATLF